MNCALEGVDSASYADPYGITTPAPNTLRMAYEADGDGGNVGGRTYLLNASGTGYEMFKLLNREFTFDVDVSTLDCGLNGALYFVAMDEDGGMSQGNNKAGAAYGTGYCDAQCPRDVKFISGEANCDDWDSTNAIGKYGNCCNEMDIWEANRIANALTPHTCQGLGAYRCDSETSPSACDHNTGYCDGDGCDYNPYRVGNTTFFGNGTNFLIDTNQVITVTTQFITSDGTDTGNLVEIRRFYSQNGMTYAMPYSTYTPQYNSISDDFCEEQKEIFGETDYFEKNGGMSQMGKQMQQGMVLVMSLWDDGGAHMLWLDSCYPTDVPCTDPGVARGSCPTSSGDPDDVRYNDADAWTTFANIRLGLIDSSLEQKAIKVEM